MVRKSDNSALNAIATNAGGDLLPIKTESTITFAAATTGTVAVHELFTVTGSVAVQLFARCTTNLAGAGATISVGTTAVVDGLIAVTTATDIDANEIWHDATPDASIELTSVLSKFIVTDDINYKILVAAVSAGVIEFIALWTPISEDGNVVAA